MPSRRTAGDGMIRQKKQGLWEGRIIVGHKENGSNIFRYVYGKTKKETAEKLRRMITEFDGVELNDNSYMTLSEWLEIWLNEHMSSRIRENTIHCYRSVIDYHINPYLGDRIISKITKEDVQRLYNHLMTNEECKSKNMKGKIISKNYVKKIHLVLHESMDYAVMENLITSNPTNGTVVPKIERKEMKVLTEMQLDLFMKAIEKDELWYDFFYTEITTGLRRGEICGLKWIDFDDQHGILHINRSICIKNGELKIGATKTGKGQRSIFLPDSTSRLLRSRKLQSESEWIFPCIKNKNMPISPSTAYQHLKSILLNNDLPSIRFHDLRHTFATHALKNGVNPKTLSGILGHTNTSFTLDTYTHITTDMQRHAAVIVGDFIDDILGDELIHG